MTAECMCDDGVMLLGAVGLAGGSVVTASFAASKSGSSGTTDSGDDTSSRKLAVVATLVATMPSMTRRKPLLKETCCLIPNWLNSSKKMPHSSTCISAPLPRNKGRLFRAFR